MDKLRVLMANEPCSYREVIAAAFRELHPHFEIICIEPDDLDSEFVRLDPHLVVCSWLSEVVQTEALAWVVLYPDGDSRTEVSIAGELTTIDDIESADLLSVLDQTALLVQFS